MRPKFINYCKANAVDYLVFQPEYAIDHAHSLSDIPFNLSSFEKLIGEISLAIVIFPEAPGSYAEAGYFSAFKNLAEKSILVLDQRLITNDSFLSIGPGKLISDKTRFHPSISMSYAEPDFDQIITRIKSRDGHRRSKGFPEGVYKNISYFDKFCIIYRIFEILQKCSLDDVHYILKGLFWGRANLREIQQISSVLLGAKILEENSDDGQFSISSVNALNFRAKDGFNEERNSIKIEIVNLLTDSGQIAAMEPLNAA